MPSAIDELLVDRDLRDDGKLAAHRLAHRLDREPISSGWRIVSIIEHVDAALGERLGLLAERVAHARALVLRTPAKT